MGQFLANLCNCLLDLSGILILKAHVPDPRLAIFAGTPKMGSIGAECQRSDPPRVAIKAQQLFAGFGTPDENVGTYIGTGDERSIGRKAHVEHARLNRRAVGQIGA